jgi:hypothetical protein
VEAEAPGAGGMTSGDGTAQMGPGQNAAGAGGAAGSSAPAGPGPDDEGSAGQDALLGRLSMGSTPLPCELDRVLGNSCRGCHAADPGQLAPMALVTHEDLMADAPSRPGTPVWELVSERVHSDATPMPPVGGGRPLVADELAVIDGWMGSGTPPGAEDCNAVVQPQETIGTITYEPPDPEEIDTCYPFLAHQNSVPGDTTPFQVRSGEFYTAFFWEVPYEGQKQAIEFRFSFTPSTHHILLYDTTEPAVDGLVNGNTTGTHPGAPDLLAAWAVNQQEVQFMPKEVGMALPVKGSGHRFLVEIHYFNQGGAFDDRSGIEVCTGKEPRANTATVSWLGSEAIVLPPHAPLDLTGTCTPQGSEDIYIFRSFPHMHEQGVAMETHIKRADGTMEELINQPFDFNNQLMFDTPAVIHPGDQLLTTCHYQNTTDRLIGVGYDSLSEMCFNFVYAWPAKALIGGVSLTGTSTPCLL